MTERDHQVKPGALYKARLIERGAQLSIQEFEVGEVLPGISGDETVVIIRHGGEDCLAVPSELLINGGRWGHRDFIRPISPGDDRTDQTINWYVERGFTR